MHSSIDELHPTTSEAVVLPCQEGNDENEVTPPAFSRREQDQTQDQFLPSSATARADELGRQEADWNSFSPAPTPTDAGSVISEEEDGLCGRHRGRGTSSQWFGAVAADFKSLALSIKETAGGVADFVHRSAVAVAAELSQIEQDELGGGGSGYSHHGSGSSMMVDERGESGDFLRKQNGQLLLPWEVRSEALVYEEDADLKEKIQALSVREETFLTPFSARAAVAAARQTTSTKNSSGLEGQALTPNTEACPPTPQPPFVLDEPRIHLVRRMLELDPKLASTHARLSGRSDLRETIFWQNYFYHCDQTRQNHLALYSSHEEEEEEDKEEEAKSTRLSASLLATAAASTTSLAASEGRLTEVASDSSFINIPSPPDTGNLSLDSLVVVEADDNYDD